MAIVDIGGLSINRGGVIRRLGGRIASSLTSRLLASRARRIVRGCGYETVAVIPWEVSHTFRRPRFAAGARRASLMELLPLRALVVGQRRRSEPTLLDAAIAEAGTASGLELRGAHETPRHGVFVVKSREAVLRVAVGPGSRQIENQFEALEALRGADVPPYVADRVPWVLARGRSGLAAWSLERRLPGSTTRPTLDQGVLDDCVEFLVALQSISGDTSHTALCAEAAEIVAAACAEGDAELVRSLAHRLDCDLEGVPRGFAHGDFFRGNLLVADRRLVGVVDWDAGGAGRLPLLDLLHLRLWSEHRPQDEDWGLVLTQHLLPWADAGGDDLARGYCRAHRARPSSSETPQPRLGVLARSARLPVECAPLPMAPAAVARAQHPSRATARRATGFRLRRAVAREQPPVSNGAEGATQAIRRISVVAPLLNEASHVDGLVADLAGQDFTGELEVIVADGGSTDGSVERLRAAARAARALQLDGARRTRRAGSRTGLNACIRAATRRPRSSASTATARYPPDYLRRCAVAAEETGAWNVGGLVVARRTDADASARSRARWTARSAASAGRGTAATDGRVEVDTVTYGAFRPEAFERAGLLRRVARAQPGRRVQPAPAASGRADRARPVDSHVYYVPRGSLRGVCQPVLRLRALEGAGDAEAPPRPRAFAASPRSASSARWPCSAPPLLAPRAHAACSLAGGGPLCSRCGRGRGGERREAGDEPGNAAPADRRRLRRRFTSATGSAWSPARARALR